MLVILKRDNEEVNDQSALLIAGAIKKKSTLTLGLAKRQSFQFRRDM